MSTQKLVLRVGNSEDAINELKSQGLEFKTEAEIELPELPSDVSQLDDEDLMYLFSKLTAYSNFLNAQFSVAMIDERDAERESDLVENMALISAHSGRATKDTVTLLKAQISADPKVIAAKEKYSATYNYRKLIEIMVNNVDRDTNLVSRELTRRTSGANFRTRSQRIFS